MYLCIGIVCYVCLLSLNNIMFMRFTLMQTRMKTYNVNGTKMVSMLVVKM